ncbi:MAG: hypothetical protein ABIZ56_13290 [Chthoniobacteraceae bacterium]
MSSRPFICLALTLILAGCAAEKEKQKKKHATEKKQEQSQKVAEDPGFLAFLGRLRLAVANKDHATLTSMMTADFGYRWDTPPVGDNVFTYWDLNDSWPVLGKLLREKFTAHGNYMVAPSAVATDPAFQGYRVGIRVLNGSWKFAYFVPAEGTTAQ